MRYDISIEIDNCGFKRFKLPQELYPIEELLLDMESFRTPIFVRYIEEVLNNQVDVHRIGGNMCSLQINKDATIVSLQFFDESKPSECSISTNNLKDIIILWMKENKDLIKDTW